MKTIRVICCFNRASFVDINARFRMIPLMLCAIIEIAEYFSPISNKYSDKGLA